MSSYSSVPACETLYAALYYISLLVKAQLYKIIIPHAQQSSVLHAQLYIHSFVLHLMASEGTGKHVVLSLPHTTVVYPILWEQVLVELCFLWFSHISCLLSHFLMHIYIASVFLVYRWMEIM